MTTKIDYTDLNDRIVRQAIEKAGFVINKDLLDKLILGKMERAKVQSQLIEQVVYHQIED